MGLPVENEAGYRDGSPITHAGKLRGNLLLVHGTGDDNCHYQATERLMEELIARGKRFSVLPYPNRTHAVHEGRNTDQHLMGTLTQFLRDNLQAAHAPAPVWMDVDRDALKAKITSLPKREDLVQIQLNEQLIVELYSK